MTMEDLTPEITEMLDDLCKKFESDTGQSPLPFGRGFSVKRR
jgi:hypothetical protein